MIHDIFDNCAYFKILFIEIFRFIQFNNFLKFTLVQICHKILHFSNEKPCYL